MSFKPLLSVGNIFSTPSTYECESMELVIADDPAESLPETGKIVLHSLHYGRQRELWHVQYGKKVINCWVPILLSEEQLKKCECIDSLPDDKIDELQNARHWAEQAKKLGY